MTNETSTLPARKMNAIVSPDSKITRAWFVNHDRRYVIPSMFVFVCICMHITRKRVHVIRNQYVFLTIDKIYKGSALKLNKK